MYSPGRKRPLMFPTPTSDFCYPQQARFDSVDILDEKVSFCNRATNSIFEMERASLDERICSIFHALLELGLKQAKCAPSFSPSR